jgi:hypothetical protein
VQDPQSFHSIRVAFRISKLRNNAELDCQFRNTQMMVVLENGR